MLPVTLRRSLFEAQKVFHRAGPPRRCWAWALCGASGRRPGLEQTCWASSARPDSRGRDSGLFKPGDSGLCPESFLSRVSQCLLRNQHFHSSAVRPKKRLQPEPPPRELDLLRYDIKNIWQSPKPAVCLGFAGLIPFVAPTLFMAMTESYFPELAYAQLAYGAAIVSFLGGARWGFALPQTSPAKPDWMNLSNSVVPSLFASLAMIMSDSIVPATTIVIMGLGISLHYDLALLPGYPSWFKALRAVLTIVAFFSLVFTLLMNGSYPEKKLFSD